MTFDYKEPSPSSSSKSFKEKIKLTALATVLQINPQEFQLIQDTVIDLDPPDRYGMERSIVLNPTSYAIKLKTIVRFDQRLKMNELQIMDT